MVLMVLYDLKKPGQEYQTLYKALMGAKDHRRPLESTWLLNTERSSVQWGAILRSCIDQNDRLFVTRLTSDYDGWLSSETWDWIRQRLN